MFSETEEKFFKSFHNAPISMTISTIEEGILLEVNEAFERLSGYTSDEVIGRSTIELGVWSDPQERREMVALLERERKVCDWEFMLRDKEGEFRSVIFSGVVFDLHGKKRLLSLVNDITERKRTEAALRESEERYRRIVETAREGILVGDATAQTIYVNRRMADILGYCEGEMLGRSLFDFIESSCHGEVLAQIEQRKKGVADWYEAIMLRKNGEKIWVTISGSPIFDQKGAYAGSFAMFSDITARKQAEEKLLASEEALRVIFNSAHDAILIHEVDGKIIDVNDKMLEMFGVDRRKALTLTVVDHYTDPDNTRDRLPVIWEMVVAGKDQFFEWRTRRFDDNALFEVEVSLRRIILNKRYAILATVRDITARKRTEQEIEILNSHLASHVTKLEAANRELEAFNYTVSHDLRSPLTGICGYSDLLQNDFSERLGEHCLRYVREINAAAVKMSQLINTLLGFSHMSRCEIELEEIDLTAIARGVAARLRMADPSRQARFTFAEGVKATGDANLLGVVMENLLGNAWKYTARQVSTLIEFGFDETDARPAYFIRDNGPGFDMAHADRLFRPFQRLPETTDFATGHGIGLATVQRIVERHGGSAWACGEPGRGATFYFTLWRTFIQGDANGESV